MADETCTTCKKQGSDTPLKRCAKCKTGWYCSRECQMADWGTHKKTCARIASQTSSNADTKNSKPNTANPPKNLSAAIDKPFHRLETKSWLHDRPKQDVYKLLIDAYRLRMQDNLTLDGKREADSIYGGCRDGRIGFRRFLRLAGKASGAVLPPWWTADHAAECEEAGLRGGWSSLGSAVEKSEIVEHYGERYMPMQLRLLGEQIYGRGPGGQAGASTLALMKLRRPERCTRRR
ncbi:MYND finger [Aspergillus sp. HF37]|nr:MYND finger [Aspergillus sp. HF37]